MQAVSQAWKDEQRSYLVGESYIEIVLNVGDPDSQADASASDNGAEKFSHTAALVDEVDKAPVLYATLEKNLWRLNGSRKILPAEGPYGENGYAGSWLSDNEGNFTSIPTITVSFSQVFTALIPGVTITWSMAYQEWADTFRLRAYNGDTVVAEQTVSGNTDITSIVELDIQNYNKITIEILKWCLPHRRARLESILVGIMRTYTKSDLMNYTHSMAADPLSASLPKAEISFSLANLDGKYDPDNPRGAAKYLMERQEITTRYGYKINGETEWIPGGTFYMSEWDTPQNGITASFTARDILEFMNGVYAGPVAGDLYSIAEAALRQAEIPPMEDGSERWQISTLLRSIQAPAGVTLAGGETIAEILQYVANAACCVLYQDRAGIFRIEPLATGSTDYRIDQFNSYQNSEISLTKQLKAVDVNEGAAVVSNEASGETQTVSNPFISAERAPIVAEWVKNYLKNRKTLSGEFRADPRLDALDRVTNENRFASTTVLVTSIKYTYNGAFHGTYEGRAGV